MNNTDEVQRSSGIGVAVGWKMLERTGFYGAKLAIQIVLARILAPEDFGAVSILLVFIDLATILVQSGLNSALVQSEIADTRDFSSIFWTTMGLSVVLYIILFIAAPIISSFYDNGAIALYLRVISVSLFGGAVNSIQVAYASRQLDFKSQFVGNSVSIILAGVISIGMAIYGLGIWSLVCQQIVWQYTYVLVMLILVKWRPTLEYEWESVKRLLSFGWKLLASSLLIRANAMIGDLIVGKRYSASSLGYYSRGSSIPSTFSDVAVNAISSVTLASVSSLQNDRNAAGEQTSRFVRFAYLFIAPLMVGVACAAEPLVSFLLSDKWLPCVPYLRVFCMLYLSQPGCAILGQAVSAAGRSDLYLRTFIIVKPIGLLLLMVAAVFYESPLAVAISVVITSFIELMLQAKYARSVLHYPAIQQVKDWLVPLLCAFVMSVPTYICSRLNLAAPATLCLQFVVGLCVYYVAAKTFKVAALDEMIELVEARLLKKR